MSIFFNLDFKSKKKIVYILNTIFGINSFFSKQICKSLGYDSNTKFCEIKKKDLNKLNSLVTRKYKVLIDTELKKEIYDNIQKMKNIRCYKGVRYTYNLPVNGQRTHTNAKTRRWRQKIK